MPLRDRLAQTHGVPAPPPVDPTWTAAVSRLHAALVADLDPNAPWDPDAALTRLTELVAADTTISPRDRDAVAQLVWHDVQGFGPLQPLLDDPSVTEIMVNGPRAVYVERGGRLEATRVAFHDEPHVLRILDKMLAPTGRHVDEASPVVDARLPDGSRLNAVIRPVAVDGPLLTIRKFGRAPLTVPQLVGIGTLSPAMADFLAAAIRGHLSLVISGGTGSGKTTTLNALSGLIPESERIVTIEDAAELHLLQAHWVRMEARPPNIEGQGAVPIRLLVRNALRMRPDRIIVGEVRGGEALDMLQAMNTGHEGSLTTAHANAPRDCLARLETMVLMAGTELPLVAVRQQIASAIDLIVQQARGPDGRRRVVQITEVVGMESGLITTQDLFVWDPDRGFLATGIHPAHAAHAARYDVHWAPALFDTGGGL